MPGEVEDITVTESLVAVAVGDGGIALLDTTDLAIQASLPLPGHAHAVAIVGQYAFVADGPGGLRVIDVRDPAAPAEVASLLDLHHIVDVAVDGDRAYLAAADEGLVVVDIADPRAPRERGRLFLGGFAFGVAADGDHVLVADGWAGLRVIDVTTPAAPRLLATVPTPAWAMDVDVEDGRAHLAAGSEYRLHELADPARPVEVGNLPMHPGHVTAVDARGGRAAVVDDTSGIRIVDVAGAVPTEVGSYAPLASANGIARVGDRVFVAAEGQGLRIVDVSDPQRLDEVSIVPTQDPVRGVAPVGTNVFFMTLARPGSPWVGSIYGMDGSASDPHPEEPFAGPLTIGWSSAGSTLYVAAELGVYVIDGRQPAPCLLAYLETREFYAGLEGPEANGISVSGDLAYVASYYDSHIWVVDVSDPRSPSLLEQPADGGGVEVGKTLAVGERLYAIGDDGGGPVIAIYDLGEPSSPRLLGTTRLPAETARGDEAGPQMAYAEGRLFVADGSAGLVVVDVSEAARPTIAGRLRLPGEAVGVVVDGDVAYVASHGGGLFAVEWSAEFSSAISDRDRAAASGSTATTPPRSRAALAAPRQWPTEPPGMLSAPTTCLVTSTSDSGPGSLRECLGEATAEDAVRFDPRVFALDAPATIRLEAPLSVPPGVELDGSDAGVVLNGAGSVDVGLRLDSQAVVRGLTVTGFTGTGIYVDGSDNTIADNVVSANGEQGVALFGPNNEVVGNLIGLDPSGGGLWGAQGVGIAVAEDGNVIGGPDAADRNVISGNAIGIDLKEVRETTVQGNYVGTDARGQVALEFERVAADISVESGSSHNRIVGNIVAGGIGVIDPGSSYNAIVGNLVGVDVTGSRAFEAGGGIVIDEPFNRVGGTLPGEGNIVNGGIAIQADQVVVLGNRFGVDARGNPLGTGGIQIVRDRAVVGGRSARAANTILGTVDGAVTVRGDANLVIGNSIRIQGIPIPDEEATNNGILVENASGNHLIANAVATEAGAGIRLGADAHANVVRGNLLQGNAVGLLADTSSQLCLVSLNAFERNASQARDQGFGNRWDDGRRGNYWSDLDASDADGDGILDDPRAVSPEGTDRFPMAQPTDL